MSKKVWHTFYIIRIIPAMRVTKSLTTFADYTACAHVESTPNCVVVTQFGAGDTGFGH